MVGRSIVRVGKRIRRRLLAKVGVKVEVVSGLGMKEGERGKMK